MHAISSIFALSLCTLSAASPVVNVLNGTILGSRCARSEANFFLAIPYARPPINDLRFASPQVFDCKYGRSGVFDATVPAASCPQFGAAAFIESGPQSEDCLKLDIYTPKDAKHTSKLPVKVWLYGGYNEAGGISNPTYDGCFSATDSIVVSVNYRLGPLGYLSMKKAGLMGNYGLQDQLLALRWIQENIGAFGGDPRQVLLFGQSAGALDTFALGSMPEIKSLISAAALESGGGGTLPTIDQAENFTTKFFEALNCSVSDPQCIRRVSVSQLNITSSELQASDLNVPSLGTQLQNNGFGLEWGPVIDGDFLKSQPADVGMRVPSIIGSNTNEGALFVSAQYKEGIANITEDLYNQFLEQSFGPLAANVSSVYSWSKYNSTTPLPGYFAMADVITDYSYKCPTYQALLTSQMNGVNVWTYSFNHTPSCSWYQGIPTDPEILQLFGPTHTAEIPFIFGLVDKLPPGGGPGSTNGGGNCSFTASEKAISSFMQHAWTRMSKDQEPANQSVWPKWSQNLSLGILVDDAVKVHKVDYSICPFWDKIDESIIELAANATSQTPGNGSSCSTLTT